MKIHGITGPTCGLITYDQSFHLIHYIPNPVDVPDWHLTIANASCAQESASTAISMLAPMVSDPKVRADMEAIARFLMEQAVDNAEFVKVKSATLYEDTDAH